MRPPYRICHIAAVLLFGFIIACDAWRRWWAVVEMPLVYVLFAATMGYQIWFIAWAFFDGTLFPVRQ